MSDKKVDRVNVVILRPFSEGQEVGQLIEMRTNSVAAMAAHVRLATDEESSTGKVVLNSDKGLKDQISILEAQNKNLTERVNDLEGRLKSAKAGGNKAGKSE